MDDHELIVSQICIIENLGYGAASPNCIRQGARMLHGHANWGEQIERTRTSDGLPIENRRYGRMQFCVTVAVPGGSATGAT